jgi:hypothetical protein
MTKLVITGLAAVHLIASLWHGSAHTRLRIELSTEQTLFVYVVIISPRLWLPYLSGHTMYQRAYGCSFSLCWEAFSLAGITTISWCRQTIFTIYLQALQNLIRNLQPARA